MKSFIVKQEDEADCGACCLSSIIKYYQGFVPLEIIKMDSFTNHDGTNYYNLKECGEKYGFEVKGILDKSLTNVKPPFIGQLKLANGLYHFVVIYQILDNKVKCMDPAIGIKVFDRNSFNQIFTGNILKFIPIGKIVYYQKNNYLKKYLIKLTKKNLKLIVIITLFSILSVLLVLSTTYEIKIILEYNSIKYIYIYCFLILIKNLLNYFKNDLLAFINRNNNINLISNYIKHFFLLPFKYLRLKDKGEIISRINDLNNIKDILSREIVNLFVSSLVLVGVLIITYTLNYYLFMLLIILSIVNFSLVFIINKRTMTLYLKAIDSETDFLNKISEDIHNISTIKNLGKDGYFLNNLSTSINNNTNNQLILTRHLNKLNLLKELIYDIGIIIILIVTVSFQISYDNVVLFLLYYNYYQDNINYLSSFITYYTYFKSVCHKINGVFYIPIENNCNKEKFVNGDIIINNLNYQVGLKKIFRNYNKIIKQGDKILLTGNNGIGKSTLLNILSGNIDDYQGLITIGKRNLKQIDKISLKNNLCYSNQDDNLFQDTILNNIILDQKLDQKRLFKIAKVLFLDDIVKYKENGYYTLVRDNLSGGERQRIILARCLYLNYPILLLDESLSEVSYNYRIKIIDNLKKYYPDKTIIYVSHYQEKYSFNHIIKLTARKEINAK